MQFSAAFAAEFDKRGKWQVVQINTFKYNLRQYLVVRIVVRQSIFFNKYLDSVFLVWYNKTRSEKEEVFCNEGMEN